MAPRLTGVAQAKGLQPESIRFDRGISDMMRHCNGSAAFA
jgi:hypothetical protein